MALIFWQRSLREACSKKQTNKWKTRIDPCICMAESLYCLPETVTTLLIGYCCSVAKLGPSLLGRHGLQHTGLPCPPLSPGACSNSHPFSQWCPPTISSSVVPFSSWSQSFPASVFSNELALHIKWKLLELQLQHQSFQWIFKVNRLYSNVK